MRELYIVRHGESEHHIGDEPLTGGWTDTLLTPFGRKQANATGLRLKQLLAGRKTAFYTSDLKRTIETAEIIGKHLAMQAQPDISLREFNNGIAAGMTQKQAKHIEDPLTESIALWRPYPGSENWLEFYQRIKSFYDRHIDDHLAVVVCHAGTAFNLTFRYLGLEEDHFGKIYTELDTCGITHLHISPYGEQCIHFLNDTGHLIGMTND